MKNHKLGLSTIINHKLMKQLPHQSDRKENDTKTDMNSDGTSNKGEAQAGQIGYFVNPLIISGAGIICSCVALATYHFIYPLQDLPSRPTSVAANRSAYKSPAEDIPCGVDPEILKKIPILPYSYKKDGAFRMDQTECSICLGELLDGEKVRFLPTCSHAFHIHRIDLWFAQNSNCPICRAPLVIAPPPSLPVSSESVVDLEERVCHQSDHNNIVASGSTSQAPLGGAMLQHSLSVACRPEQEKPHDLMMGMKRSLSMDHFSYVSICIQKDEGNKAAYSSMLMMSFAQFRNSRNNDRSKGILPN